MCGVRTAQFVQRQATGLKVHTTPGNQPAHYSMGSGTLSGGLSGRSVKLITHLRPRLRMRAAILLPHSTPLWHQKGLYNTTKSETKWPNLYTPPLTYERLTKTCQESVSRPRFELVTPYPCQKHQPLEPTSYSEFCHDACLVATTRMMNRWAPFIWRALAHKRSGCNATWASSVTILHPIFFLHNRYSFRYAIFYNARPHKNSTTAL